eukprot:scaffold58947_cov19-Tisochrysis_lutea.AAC.1
MAPHHTTLMLLQGAMRTKRPFHTIMHRGPCAQTGHRSQPCRKAKGSHACKKKKSWLCRKYKLCPLKGSLASKGKKRSRLCSKAKGATHAKKVTPYCGAQEAMRAGSPQGPCTQGGHSIPWYTGCH